MGNSRYALRQSSPTSPGMAALLGGAQGPHKTKSTPVEHQRFVLFVSVVQRTERNVSVHVLRQIKEEIEND